VNTDVRMRYLGGRGRVFEAPGIGLGIGFDGPGQSSDDPGVATFFLSLLDLAASPPGDRVPPVESEDDGFEASDPVIAALEVSQFVDQDGIALLLEVHERRGHELEQHQEPEAVSQDRALPPNT